MPFHRERIKKKQKPIYFMEYYEAVKSDADQSVIAQGKCQL
jgi:hypothetical protein